VITIIAERLNGTGTPPNELGIGSYVYLTAIPDRTIYAYFWEFVSIPSSSTCFIYSPTGVSTKVGPFDVTGTYQIKLSAYTDSVTYKSRTYSLCVVASANPAMPPDPQFQAAGGPIRNFSFSVPGDLPGYAYGWDVEDTAGVLSGASAGVSRGRIIPLTFVPTYGTYVFCLGDEYNATATFAVGDVFSISQVIDFTDIDKLTINLKITDN
jgi:hypothetical protein